MNRYFLDGWCVLPDVQEREGKGEKYSKWYKDQMSALSVYSHNIMSSPNCYYLNLCDVVGAHRLTIELVRLDRLPEEKSLEGLLLLQDAWCDHDVAVYTPKYFKLGCKVRFVLQLVVSYLAIVGSTMF